MNRSALSAAGLALAVILFVAVNVFSNNAFRAARLDLTAAKLFTLSAGSRAIIAGIEEPISLRLYYTTEQANRLPSVELAQLVLELCDAHVEHILGLDRAVVAAV